MPVGCDREIFDCADQTGFKPADIGQRWWVGQRWVCPLQTGETGEEMVDLTLTEAGANQPVGVEFCPGVESDQDGGEIGASLRVGGVPADHKVVVLDHPGFFPVGTSFPGEVGAIHVFSDYTLQP